MTPPATTYEQTENGLVLVRVKDAAKWITIRALSQIYGISRTLMEEKLSKLRASYQVTMIDWDGTRLIDIKEFQNAVFRAATTIN
ncbi:MAG: hypothetical protein RR888_09445 [Akkermansia sp.]